MTMLRTIRFRLAARDALRLLAALALLAVLAACGPDGPAAGGDAPPPTEAPAPDDPAPDETDPEAPEDPAPEDPAPGTASSFPVDVCVATTPVSEPDARTCRAQEVAFTVPSRP